MVSADDVVRQAQDQSGLDDVGSTHFLEPLACWVRDLDQSTLSDAGRSVLTDVAVGNLRTRLAVVDCLRRNPEIADVDLPPIVLIAGFARSGTTLLHNLLSCHPRTRAFQRWELVRPVPPPEAAAWSDDPRRAVVQSSVDALRGSELERLHWVNAADPEECPWGFYDCRGLLGRGAAAVMPRWTDHLLEHRSPETFVEYRALLQLLLWKNPPPSGSMLVLKSPLTTPELSEFAAAFPEARFVFTHRDPFRVVTSINAVADAVASPLCVRGARPGAEDGRGPRTALRIVRASAAAMVNLASTGPDRIAHVHYPDLMARPVEAVTAALTTLSLDVGEGAANRVKEFLARQRATRAAPPTAYEHSYTVEDVWDDRVVASYCSTFGVEQERRRLTEPVIGRASA